jgi:hypothetical protein
MKGVGDMKQGSGDMTGAVSNGRRAQDTQRVPRRSRTPCPTCGGVSESPWLFPATSPIRPVSRGCARSPSGAWAPWPSSARCSLSHSSGGGGGSPQPPLSTTIAIPCPTPMHIIATPYRSAGRLPAHLVHQGGKDPRPRSPQGVPQHDRAPVRVEAFVPGIQGCGLLHLVENGASRFHLLMFSLMWQSNGCDSTWAVTAYPEESGCQGGRYRSVVYPTILRPTPTRVMVYATLGAIKRFVERLCLFWLQFWWRKL